MAIDRAVRWRPVHGIGIEHVHLSEDDDGILAHSVVIGEHDGYAFGARYELRLDRDWTFRAALFQRMDGPAIELTADGRGNWFRDSVVVPELAGCIDVDLAATPLTNTLPIRRVRYETGVPRRFRMVWISPDTLEAVVNEQAYTKLDDRRFRYQSADGTFEAELTVDADGLVVDYPGLFARA